MSDHDRDEPFIDQLLSGHALLEDIDDFVDAWHDGDSDLPLGDFLGMRRDEYKLWVERPSALRFIVFARKQGKPLQQALSLFAGGDFAADRMAARGGAGTTEEAAALCTWLAQTGRMTG